MTQEEKHVELLKAAYQKWHDSKAGSIDYWLGLMTDDIKFRSLGAGAAEIEFTRTSTCKEEVKRYFAGLTSDWEMIHYLIDEYIAQGERVVAGVDTRLIVYARRPSEARHPVTHVVGEREF